MEVKWKKLFTKTVIWLAAEIILNSLGLDTLADYSEFVFDKNAPSSLISSNQFSIIGGKFDDFWAVGENY